MKLLDSKQTDVLFTYCPHPVTIDKSAEWGVGNVQQFPNGVFFKHDEFGEVTHGVQPDGNPNDPSPVGWFWNGNHIDEMPIYDKLPIWVNLDNPITPEMYVGDISSIFVMQTLDGVVEYEIKEPMIIVANSNSDEDGPDPDDTWLISLKNLKENYNM